MSESISQLIADFGNPPVIEVVCRVQFKPVSKLHAASVGLFWHGIREDYPNATPKGPVENRVELDELPVDESETTRAIIFEDLPTPRTMLTHKDPTWVIQIQPDSFFQNWRKEQSQHPYPMFPYVFKRFKREWQKFEEFVKTAINRELIVDQFELTYINHIACGEGWKTVADIGNVFPDLSWRNQKGRFLKNPHSLHWRSMFDLPDKFGRLYISLQKAIRRTTKEDLLLCELTARGIPKDCDNAMDRWFEVAHSNIVNGFLDLTAPDVQQDHWKRLL